MGGAPGWDTLSESDLSESGLGHEARRAGGHAGTSVRGRLMWAALWIASMAVAGLLGRSSSPPQSSSVAPLREGVPAPLISAAEEKTPGFYDLYAMQIATAKHIDLTHPFSPKTPVWPGFGPSAFKAGTGGKSMDGFVKEGDEYTYEVHGFQTSAYDLVTDQLGTQLDPPAHWNEFGATISDLPATFALRPLVNIDIHEKVSSNSSYHGGMADAHAWEAKHGTIPNGSVVMFRSDWHKGWDGFVKDGLPSTFPGVDLDVLKFLHNDRSILFHGHEALDTDMTPTLEGEAWLMHNHFAQAEGVANLDQVPESGCLLSIGFAKPLGGTGGFARYVAICPEDTPHGASVAEAPGAPLPKQPHPLRRNADGVLEPKAGAAKSKYCGPDAPALGCEGPGHPVW